MTATIFETQNLIVRQFTINDAAFIFELLNTPAWKQFIGDRGIETIDDAVNYITNGPLAAYDKYGYGLWLVALKETGQPIGMCGLVKRNYLSLPDIGFAFLPGFEGKGYGYESAMGTIAYAGQHYQLPGLFATTVTGNTRSQRLLARCGFMQKDIIKPEGVNENLILYYRDL